MNRFFYVYVIKSIDKDFVYVCFTHDLKNRLEEHNNHKNLSTKHYAPFDLIHYEAYKNEKDAKRREEYLKTTKGKTTLKTMLNVKRIFQFRNRKTLPLKSSTPLR